MDSKFHIALMRRNIGEEGLVAVIRHHRGPWAVALIALLITACAAAVASANTSHGSTGAATRAGGATSASIARTSVPFKVLLFVPTSGTFAVPGQEELDGFKAAANVINRQGGLLGHKVVLTIVNDQDVGTTAVAEAQQQLASGTRYNLIIPGINGADAIPLAGVLARTNVLQITSAAEAQLDQPAKYPDLFMALNDFPANEQAIVTELQAKGISKIAYISGDDPSGQDAGAALAAAAHVAGITMTASVLVPDTAVDAKPQFQQALASDPQAIVIGAYTGAAATIVAARAALGNTLPFYGDAFFASLPLQAVLKQPGQLQGIEVEDFPFLVKGAPAQKTTWYQTFAAAFNKLDPQPVLSLNAGVVPYNVLMLARAAATKAGSISGAAIAKAMAKVTIATQVPGFVGSPTTGIFSARQHQLQVKPANFNFYRAGSTINGLLVPGS